MRKKYFFQTQELNYFINALLVSPVTARITKPFKPWLMSGRDEAYKKYKTLEKYTYYKKLRNFISSALRGTCFSTQKNSDSKTLSMAINSLELKHSRSVWPQFQDPNKINDSFSSVSSRCHNWTDTTKDFQNH